MTKCFSRCCWNWECSWGSLLYRLIEQRPNVLYLLSYKNMVNLILSKRLKRLFHNSQERDIFHHGSRDILPHWALQLIWTNVFLSQSRRWASGSCLTSGYFHLPWSLSCAHCLILWREAWYRLSSKQIENTWCCSIELQKPNAHSYINLWNRRLYSISFSQCSVLFCFSRLSRTISRRRCRHRLFCCTKDAQWPLSNFCIWNSWGRKLHPHSWACLK